MFIIKDESVNENIMCTDDQDDNRKDNVDEDNYKDEVGNNYQKESVIE